MSLTMSYLSSVKNLESIFNSLIGAKAPDKFTTKFLEDLGFKSSNDRLLIGMLKAMGFLDDSGSPTQRYFQFLDQSQSKKILADGIQDAYGDLFNLRKDAQNMTNEEVRNKLRTLTQGQKSDRVIELMAMTFKALCNYADWTGGGEKKMKSHVPQHTDKATAVEKIDALQGKERQIGLCYNIQIHLPETTNMAIYDAIFQSLKKHLI